MIEKTDNKASDKLHPDTLSFADASGRFQARFLSDIGGSHWGNGWTRSLWFRNIEKIKRDLLPPRSGTPDLSSLAKLGADAKRLQPDILYSLMHEALGRWNAGLPEGYKPVPELIPSMPMHGGDDTTPHPAFVALLGKMRDADGDPKERAKLVRSFVSDECAGLWIEATNDTIKAVCRGKTAPQSDYNPYKATVSHRRMMMP